jgi:hypothetical protein
MEKTGPLFPRGWSPAHRETWILFATTAFVRFADSDVARVAVGFGAKGPRRAFDRKAGEKFIADRQRSLERCAEGIPLKVLTTNADDKSTIDLVDVMKALRFHAIFRRETRTAARGWRRIS